jgi:hypothetical protein
MPARNPQAVRQRAIAAAHKRTGQPTTPTLDPVFVALNPGALPARPRSEAELYQWVRREEQSPSWAPTWWSSCAAKATPAGRPLAPGPSFAGSIAPSGWPANAPAAPTAATPTAPVGPIAPTDLTNPSGGAWRPMPADPTQPDQFESEERFRAERSIYGVLGVGLRIARPGGTGCPAGQDRG